MNTGSRRESDEALIEKHIERPRRQLKMTALTVAQSKGMVVDDIERDALDELKAESNIERLIIALAWTGGPAEAHEVWTLFFRRCFNSEDYRLAFEVRRFVKRGPLRAAAQRRRLSRARARR